MISKKRSSETKLVKQQQQQHWEKATHHAHFKIIPEKKNWEKIGVATAAALEEGNAPRSFQKTWSDFWKLSDIRCAFLSWVGYMTWNIACNINLPSSTFRVKTFAFSPRVFCRRYLSIAFLTWAICALSLKVLANYFCTALHLKALHSTTCILVYIYIFYASPLLWRAAKSRNPYNVKLFFYR